MFEFKVIIIGDVCVGKKSLVQRYVYDSFRSDRWLTIGVDFALKEIKWTDNRTIKLHLMNIAGEEGFDDITRVYYEGAHACIVMFDISQWPTFQNAVKWKTDLDTKCSLEDGSPVPCLLIANKCDLSHRAVEQEEIEEICREHKFVDWIETSVKDGHMVEECMRLLIKEMMNKHAEINGTDHDQEESIKLNSDSRQMESTSRCSC